MEPRGGLEPPISSLPRKRVAIYTFEALEPRTRLERAYLGYESRTSPSMLTRPNTWSRRRYSKSHHTDTNRALLPLELLRRNCAGVLPLDNPPEGKIGIRTDISGSLERVTGHDPVASTLATSRFAN
jgi:hypothetical protein